MFFVKFLHTQQNRIDSWVRIIF